MNDGYAVLSLDELETAGFRAARVNAWRADAGDELVPPREEDNGSEELYVVVRGRARFTVGEEEADAPAGTLVFVPPEVLRTAIAAEEGTIVFVANGTVGE
jgi:mannose-6-phosphate isomerase-like protein (cupin superfamily)